MHHQIHDMGEHFLKGISVIEEETECEDDHELNQQDEQYDEVGVQLHSFLFVDAHPEVLPIDVVGLSRRHYLEGVAVVDEPLGVALVLVKEEVAVVLVLEGYESVTDEVGEIEEETVVRCVLVVEHDAAVVDELNLLGQGGEAVLLFIVPDLFH
jgi:hypothetical protein